jgi:hypothetical protein
MIEEKIIKQIKNSPVWQSFMDYVASRVDELDTVGDLSQKSDCEAGQIAKARNLAIEKLTEIFSIFVDNEKKEKTPQEIINAKNKFGL